MVKSRDLAALIGPALMAITASEALNYPIFVGISPSVIYLDGVVAFVAGFAIIRAHNRWSRHWPVFVTLAGWLLAALGLARMFAPEAAAVAPLGARLVGTILVFALGGVLSFKAYGPGQSRQDAPP